MLTGNILSLAWVAAGLLILLILCVPRRVILSALENSELSPTTGASVRLFVKRKSERRERSCGF